MTGLHNLFHPTIRDGRTWSKFGAYGEHGDVFLLPNLGALWFSENLITYSLHICLREVKNNFFSIQTLLFTAFLVTVLKILTYVLVSTWSSVSSGYEHVPQLMQPCTTVSVALDWYELNPWGRCAFGNDFVTLPSSMIIMWNPEIHLNTQDMCI